MIVVDPGFRFSGGGNAFSLVLVECLRNSGEDFCDDTAHPVWHSFVSMSVLLRRVENTFNKGTGDVPQCVLSILHLEQNLVSLKLNQNEADRISSCIVRNNDIR